MTMAADNFAEAVVQDLLLEDFRNSKPLIRVLMDSPTSRRITDMALRNGNAGGFAKKLTIPLLKQHALSPTDGYATETNFASGTYVNPDLSSAYPESSDYPVYFDLNRVFVGTHYLPDMRKWTHAAGEVLQDAEIRANLSEIYDEMEEAIIADMTSASRFESASGAGTYFGWDTSASANLMTDVAQLATDFNVLNIPDDDRWVVLPAAAEAAVVRWAELKSSDYVPAGVGNSVDGKLTRFGGFNLLYSNNLTSTVGVAFSTAKYAVSLPKGIVIETLRDKDRIGDYTRIYTMCGFGAIGEIVAAADGNSPTYNAQRAGVWKLTVA